jgi:uncharacterized cysteine cluster protein YcgN (CxxCxxCC family)
MARHRLEIKPDFWKSRALRDLSPAEWEALCDRCGLCCLEKLEDPDTGEIYLTSITCQFFELSECNCLIYDHRHDLFPDCTELTPHNLEKLHWLPESCAYRLLANGQDLPAWHHLVCGDRQEVHRAGVSVQNKAVCGRYADPSDCKTAIIGPPIKK